MSEFATREFKLGTSRSETEEIKILREVFCPVDWSAHPGDNSSRKKKLGGKRASWAGYVCDYDVADGRALIADGLVGFDASHQPFEPDHWAMRRHKEPNKKDRDVVNAEANPPPAAGPATQLKVINIGIEPGGDGGDGSKPPERVWNVRLNVDRENIQAHRSNRSTLVMDQRDEQLTADLHNVFWVQKVPVFRKFYEDEYDKAGMLKNVCTREIASVSGINREGEQKLAAHLCLAMNYRGGHWTDGRRIGQSWHVLAIPNEESTEGHFDDKRKFDEKVEVKFSQLMMRADAHFLGKWAMGSTQDCDDPPVTNFFRAHGPMSISPWTRPKVKGIPFRGNMCWMLNEEGTFNPLLAEDEPEIDENDDSKPLPRLPNQLLAPYACIPIATDQ